MGGVDVMDAMLEGMQSRGVVLRWPTRVFSFMLAAACLSGYFVYSSRYPDARVADMRHGGRRRFAQELGANHRAAQIQRRAELFTARGVLAQPTITDIVVC